MEGRIPKTPLVAAGLLLVAGILGAVALGVTWAHLEDSINTGGGFFGGSNIQFEGDYGAFQVTFEGDTESYSSSDLDDVAGIGKMRAGGPLLAIGMGFAFVGLVLSGLDVLVPRRLLDWGAVGAAGLSLGLGLAGTLLLRSGIQQSIDEGFGPTATGTWTAGSWLAFSAAGLALAAAVALVAGILVRRHADRPAGEGDADGLPAFPDEPDAQATTDLDA